jgi:hypothetical protein
MANTEELEARVVKLENQVKTLTEFMDAQKKQYRDFLESARKIDPELDRKLREQNL